MAKRPLAERRYKTAARLRAGSEIMGRGEGLDAKTGRDQSRVVSSISINQSQSAVGNNDLVSVCWGILQRGRTWLHVVSGLWSPSSLPSSLTMCDSQ